jgi:CRISPR system Cascade subunit CasD
MATLLFQLAGPMQSWGISSHFSRRDTGSEPSKSGVVGLLCAALGRPRTAPVADLAALRMGVRVDREGIVMRDYHTAQDVRRASGGTKKTELSERFYLADAVFLVGMEGDAVLLQTVEQALHNPVWPLCLGRKACVPGVPPALPEGYRPDEILEQALERWPPLLPPATDQVRRFVLEQCGPVEPHAGIRIETRQDQPLSFQHGQRRYTLRQVVVRSGMASAEVY